MVLQGMAALLVEGVAPAGRLAQRRVGRHQFRHPRELLEEVRHFVAEVHQRLMGRWRRVAMPNQHRRWLASRRQGMGHEAVRAEDPQALVQARRLAGIGSMGIDSHAAPPGLLDDAAGIGELVARHLVEVDAGHAAGAAALFRYSTRRLTGRPEAPLSMPLPL